MIVDSLKTDADLVNITVKWLPSELEFSNYVVAYKQLNYLNYIKNSAIVAIVATIGHVLSCAFVGYGFARYRFPGKSVLFGGVILSMIVPVQVLIFPLYMQYSQWNWLDSYLPLLVPTFFGFGLNGAFFVNFLNAFSSEGQL